MKRINSLLFIKEISKFKIITDEHNTEFIVFENSNLNSVSEIIDKTQFEAVENHIHILDNIKPKEFNEILPIAESLGSMLLCCLKQNFPERKFFVFVSIEIGESFIIRFHQQWENEEPYYYPANFTEAKEKLFIFEG